MITFWFNTRKLCNMKCINLRIGDFIRCFRKCLATENSRRVCYRKCMNPIVKPQGKYTNVILLRISSIGYILYTILIETWCYPIHIYTSNCQMRLFPWKKASNVNRPLRTVLKRAHAQSVKSVQPLAQVDSEYNPVKKVWNALTILMIQRMVFARKRVRIWRLQMNVKMFLANLKSQRDCNSNCNFKVFFRKKIAVACANAVSRLEYQRNAFTNIPRLRMKLA